MRVYIAKNLHSSLVKIGRTNNISQRKTTLKHKGYGIVYSTEELSKKRTWHIEIIAHRILESRGYLVEGREYFNCEYKTAKKLIELLVELNSSKYKLIPAELSKKDKLGLVQTNCNGLTSVSLKCVLLEDIKEGLYVITDSYFDKFCVLVDTVIINKNYVRKYTFIGKDYSFDLLNPNFEAILKHGIPEELMPIAIRAIERIINLFTFEVQSKSQEISLKTLKLSWYSNDLGDKRDALMLFLRAIYCGTDATSDYVKDVLGSLGIHGRAWQNSDGNLTIEVLVGKNKYISITLYAKDLDPKCAAIDTDRVQNLIRWDCTLFRAFLNNNKILKLKDFEKKYVELCEKDKYDIGFIRYLANLIQEKLYMKYLINLQVQTYKEAVKALNGIKSKRLTTIEKDGKEIEVAVEEIIVKHWLDYGKSFNTKREFANHLDIPESTLKDALTRISKKTTLNFDVPRSTHEAVLFNRENATLSMVERGERLLDIKGVSNSAIKRIESVKRDKDNSETFSKLLENTSMENPFKIRRFTPKSFTPNTFYLLNPLPYYEKGTNKEPKSED